MISLKRKLKSKLAKRLLIVILVSILSAIGFGGESAEAISEKLVEIIILFGF